MHVDRGHPVPLQRPVERVVSLVPSLTESIAVTRPDTLVGATDWCTHPAQLDVQRVRGTKNPNLEAITALRPDVVLANKEENRRKDVAALRAAGIPVWRDPWIVVGRSTFNSPLMTAPSRFPASGSHSSTDVV